jgi:hypothetical protein
MYILYGTILLSCVTLTLCHFIIFLVKRRRVKEFTRDYQLRRESFAALAAGPFPQTTQFQSVQDAFKITTDGITDMSIEIPDDYPFPLLRNGLENGVYPVHKFMDHRHRPINIPKDYNKPPGVLEELYDFQNNSNVDDHLILSQRNMNTNIVTVDVHTAGTRRNSDNFSFDHGSGRGRNNNFMTGPRTLAVATVSQSYNSMNDIAMKAISIPVPTDPIVGGISRPQSAVSLSYDIADCLSSSPEISRKAEIKKSPKTC